MYDNELYVRTTGQGGGTLMFSGWADEPVEISNETENAFNAKRGFKNYDGEVYAYWDFSITKDENGNWIINNVSAQKLN